VRRHIVKIAPTDFFSDYGCHVRILEEARLLQTHGHDVTILTYPGGNNPENLRIIRIPKWLGGDRPRVGSRWNKLLLDPALLAMSLAQMARRRIDVVHAHLHEGVLVGWPLARLHRARLIFDYQGSLTREMVDHQFVNDRSPALSIFGGLERLANQLADKILTSSENSRTTLIENFGVDPSHVLAVTDGVDVKQFRPRELKDGDRLLHLRRRLGIPVDRLIVGYLGLLAEYQGTGDLIRAAQDIVRRTPGAHFLVMGFPNTEAYRAAAAEAGLANHMTFTGRVAYADAPEMLRLLDIAVAPKRSETEGNGKVLNYMAAGLPTVTYDGPVTRELLGNHGLRVPVGSVPELGRSIERYLVDSNLRKEHGAQLRRRAEQHYSWDRQILRILDVYTSLWGTD
jgi:glycosyltransferase involved in cell wall biosynthesis